MKIKLKGNYKNRQVTVDGKELSPERSLKIANHSPDGFLWGYGGSAPSQLALAIMLEYCPDEQHAINIYQHFKWEEIANLPMEDIDIEIDLSQYLMPI